MMIWVKRWVLIITSLMLTETVSDCWRWKPHHNIRSVWREIFSFSGHCTQGSVGREYSSVFEHYSTCLPFQRRTDLNVKKFLDRYKLLHINIDFKNEYQPNVLRIEFAFTAADGTLQKNIFKYRKDPKDRKKLLFQVSW